MPDTEPDSSKAKIDYIIFGCGSTGYHVIEELSRETDRILVIDNDQKRVEDLRMHKHEAILRDLRDPALLEDLPVPETAFVLSNDKDANLAAVRSIKSRHPSTHVIARAVDPVSTSMLQDAGSDLVIYPQEFIAKAAVRHIKMFHASRLARSLYDRLAGWEGTLGIVTHTNPDPDSISSAMALAAIAAEASDGKLQTRILYSGNIGHQENKAFVNMLDIRMERITPQVLAECRYLALVDSSSPGENNDLPRDARINIVIDHHRNGDPKTLNADFVDNRPGMGATASIMTQYLQDLDIPVSKKVATALFYGIRADTRDFRRSITPSDLTYAAFLLPLTDADLLDKIISPAVSQETLDVLGHAIRNKKIRSGYLFSNVGFVRNRDAIPQAADLLIGLEGVNTALVYGIGDSAIYISARNRDIRLHIGNVLKEAFGDIGDAGGHANMGAVTIPLAYFSLVKTKEDLLSLVQEPIISKFLRVVGLEKEENHDIFEL
ncbi:MAG: DHH family phosphoesterase [Methanomicrobiales archaeon]|nr:DHH family phosphoesterase [Methanomicrobiales archaeon]MDI6876132.1 DHH family phosphoesterase [Methanomicrobiales archaeon]